MVVKKKKKATKTGGVTPVADASADKSGGDSEQIKWRWPVVVSALVALSVFVLFLSWIKFFDLIGLDRNSQALLVSYVGDTQSRPFDDRVALILVDKNKPSVQPATQPAVQPDAAAAPNQPAASNQPPAAANQPLGAAGQIYGASNPSHRRFHIELIRSLTKAGAKVVVFDVLFITSLPETDPEFAKAIQESENAGTKIVVGAFLQPNVYDPQISSTIKTAVGEHWGIVDGGTQKDSDALWARLAADKGNEPFNGLDEKPVFPSLALQAVRLLKYPNTPTSFWFSPLSGQVRLRNGGGELLDAVPVNRDMYLLVDLPGKDEIPHFSYQEVLAHQSDYAANFKDKIVVVGYQEGDALPSSAAGKETRYGAEIHAAAMSTLLTGAFIKPLPVLYHSVFIVVLVAMAAFLQIRFSKWMSRMQTVPLPLLPAPFNKITIPTPILVVSLVYLLFAVLVFKLTNVVFAISYHLTALVLTYFLFVICRSQFIRK